MIDQGPGKRLSSIVTSMSLACHHIHPSLWWCQQSDFPLGDTSSFQLWSQMVCMELMSFSTPRVGKGPVGVFLLMNDSGSQSLIPVQCYSVLKSGIGTLEKEELKINPTGIWWPSNYHKKRPSLCMISTWWRQYKDMRETDFWCHPWAVRSIHSWKQNRS